MTMATCIKYVSVLLVPFLVWYYLRDKKITKKLLYCVLYAILFMIIVLCLYAIYAKELKIFTNSFMQQSKYRDSIQAIALQVSRSVGFRIDKIVKLTSYMIFLYLIYKAVVDILLKNKIIFSTIIRKYNIVLLAFIFLIITNLCPWYMSWIIPTIFWLKGKDIKLMLYIQFSYELVTMLNFAMFSESYIIGLMYIPLMFCIIGGFLCIDTLNKTNKFKEIM